MPRPPLGDRLFAAVLFDLDGTLIDSTAAVVRSWVAWAGQRGIDPERLRGFHGVPAAGVIAALCPHLDQAAVAAEVQRVEALEVADTAGIEILPGALAALATLGSRAAIVTSCTDRLLHARLAATGLPAPATVVTASMVERGKPHPEPFLLAAEWMGVSPGECLVVEDAVSGLAAATAAGAGGRLAVTTTTPAAQLAPVADLVVADLAAVRFDVGTTGAVTLAER